MFCILHCLFETNETSTLGVIASNPRTSRRREMSKVSKPTGSKSQRRIRYAVVGQGHIAQVAVLPAFHNTPNSELAAIVSSDAAKREQLTKKYHLNRAYSYEEYDRALSQIEAVYLAVPNHLHREYAVRAAEAGVHVLCEKPMAVTEEECRAMIDAAERNDVKLMVAYRLHFEAGNLEAIQLAESGRLGDLRIFTSEFAQQIAKDNVRATESVERGGGPLYDMGVYCINAARYLLRSEPNEVLAVTANNGEDRFRNTEEMDSVFMRFSGERLATFTCSFGATDVSRYSLIGTKGRLTADPAYEYAMAIKHQITIGQRTKAKTFPKRDQFAAEISYFSDCILNNKEPEPSGLEGLADVRIVQAIYESAQTGKTVRLSELAAKKRPTMDQEIHRPAHEEPRTVRAKSPTGEAA
jgi:predicted dehydrogenase